MHRIPNKSFGPNIYVRRKFLVLYKSGEKQETDYLPDNIQELAFVPHEFLERSSSMMDISEELSKFKVGSKEYIFFEKVFSKLGQNFVRKSVEDRLRETHNNLNKAKQKYFEWHVLASAVIKSTDQLETSQDLASSSSNVNEISSKDIHPLYLNIVRKYLPPEDSEPSTSLKLGPFGLNQQNTLKAVKNKKSEAKSLVFKKLVEENVKDFCIRITQCIGDNVSLGSDWEKAFDRAMKNLESKLVLLSSEESKEQSKKQLRTMIKTYNKIGDDENIIESLYSLFILELSEGVSMLSKLLSLHEQNLEFDSNLAEFYLHRCQAISLKIKLFQLKILEATYNQETIPALKKISTQLEQSERKLKEEENETTVALEQYLKLGGEYERFVDEYVSLTKSIKEQQWAIDELKNRKSQYEVSSPI